MTEERVFINNGNLIIEGLLYKASKEKCVVICHPHSLMGGSMYNNVVEAVQAAFAAGNISTLRFNFRGVGGSAGAYDEGRGEQEDIMAVCEYLKNAGMTELLFAGYSFGAWVGSKIIEEKNNPFSFCVFIAPPIDYFPFEWNNLKNKIALIICGDDDPFCSLNVLIHEAKQINAPLEIIHGADHFYAGKERYLALILQKI